MWLKGFRVPLLHTCTHTYIHPDVVLFVCMIYCGGMFSVLYDRLGIPNFYAMKKKRGEKKGDAVVSCLALSVIPRGKRELPLTLEIPTKKIQQKIEDVVQGRESRCTHRRAPGGRRLFPLGNSLVHATA